MRSKCLPTSPTWHRRRRRGSAGPVAPTWRRPCRSAGRSRQPGGGGRFSPNFTPGDAKRSTTRILRPTSPPVMIRGKRRPPVCGVGRPTRSPSVDSEPEALTRRPAGRLRCPALLSITPGGDEQIADGHSADGRIADEQIADGRIADGRIADGRIADGRIARATWPAAAPATALPRSLPRTASCRGRSRSPSEPSARRGCPVRRSCPGP